MVEYRYASEQHKRTCPKGERGPSEGMVICNLTNLTCDVKDCRTCNVPIADALGGILEMLQGMRP